ncbi:MAG TPA: ricin-type beta-trefoil lectin domain protein [Pseudonocardiaceae bacterium]|nr:ricin-type beta-trefoil lectin domain protein [Pseudonocardiaceae bacterium]
MLTSRFTTALTAALAVAAATALAIAGSPATAAGVTATGATGTSVRAAVAAPASTDCSPNGSTSIEGNAYIVQDNEWNSTAQQCITYSSGTAWSVSTANFSPPPGGAPNTYPSIYQGCHWGSCTTGSGMPIQVSNLASATTSWSTTQPASGAYDVAYDIWFNSTPTTGGQPDGTELMIWLNSRGGVSPFGSQTGTATVDGDNWNVWTGQQTSWKIISYVLDPGGTAFTDLDLKALINDAVSRGSIDPANYLIDVEAGFEIWQGGQGLATNSFSVTATAGGGTTGNAGPITGYAGLCLDDRGASTADYNPVQVYTCNGTAAQQWTVTGNTLQTLGKCLDVDAGATANGTAVDLYDCNGTGAQVWQPQADGALLNPQSGACLDDPDSSTTAGTQVQIWACSGAANQQWKLP